MASQNLNVGTSANSNDGDTLRGAFIKLKQMFAEVYGQTYSEQGDLSGTDFKINESKLQLTASGTASDDGKVLTYDHATGGFSWEDAFTGTIGDITGIVAGDGLTGSSLSSDEATINVVAGTGITVAADSVSLATSVQDEITANTAKVGITATQAGHITANNAKVSDQTVTLTDGGNVTITGTYPDFTLSSPDVTGAVTSVNGAVGVVVLDTADVAEDTNLYYTEARVAANSAVAANTAKTGITTAQAGEITANNAKVTNATHTGDVTGDGVLTIANNVVNATKLDVTGDGTAGQLLQSDGDGSMTWVTGVTGDITAVTAGDGLTGGGTGGDVTVSLDANVAGDGLTLTTGVLSVDTIQTGDVADDAITSPKLAEFDDTFTAGTTGDIIVSNGTDFIHATMSGDATIVAGGAITIADDAVNADKLADSINTDIAAGVAKVSFPGFGTTAGTALEGDTDLLQVGTLATEALAGNTTTITAQQISDITDNNAKVTNATHTGEVTGSGALTITNGAVVADRLATDAVTTVKILDANVTTDKIADVNVTAAKLANGAVNHDKLEDRYTEAVSVTTLTGAYSLDWSTGAIFVMSGSLTGNIEFDFTNYKVGQTIDIYNLTGAHSITFDSDAATSETFNKCGGVDYAGASTNLIQVQCVDDSANAVFNYAVSAYVSDTTPS